MLKIKNWEKTVVRRWRHKIYSSSRMYWIEKESIRLIGSRASEEKLQLTNWVTETSRQRKGRNMTRNQKYVYMLNLSLLTNQTDQQRKAIQNDQRQKLKALWWKSYKT